MIANKVKLSGKAKKIVPTKSLISNYSKSVAKGRFFRITMFRNVLIIAVLLHHLALTAAQYLLFPK